MTTLKERLTRKIEIDAEKWADEKNRYSDDPSYACDYIAGALSLIPLIEELSTALESYSAGDFTPIATEALQSLERFVEGSSCQCGDINARNCQYHQANLNDSPESSEESW